MIFLCLFIAFFSFVVSQEVKISLNDEQKVESCLENLGNEKPLEKDPEDLVGNFNNRLLRAIQDVNRKKIRQHKCEQQHNPDKDPCIVVKDDPKSGACISMRRQTEECQ